MPPLLPGSPGAAITRRSRRITRVRLPPLPVVSSVAGSSDASQRADDVDVVAHVERAGQELVGVAVELECPLLPGDLRSDAALGRSAEAPGRHLLAGVDGLRRDQVAKLLGTGDRARNHLRRTT